MPAKTKMKKYVTEMFSTKESTSSTEGLLASQLSGIAAPSQVAPLLLHSLPLRPSAYRPVYRPTTVSVHKSGHYDKIPSKDPRSRNYDPRPPRRSLLRRLFGREDSMSVDSQLESNLRQAFAEGKGKDVDAKNTSVQAQDEEEAGESRLGPQVMAALSVSMGSMVVGFVSGYTSPASVSMQNSTDILVTDAEASWIGGIMPFGALVGGIAGGPLIDAIGRKRTILSTAIPFIFSFLLIAFADSVPFILSGRVLSGFCVGVASLALPVYLGESVQPEVRGTLGLLPTAFGNTGILLVYSAGMFLNWWQLAFFGALVPIPFVILTSIIPETPMWYIVKGQRENSQKSLQWLRGKDADIQKEFSELEKNALHNSKGQNSLQSLFSKSSAKPVFITIGLMFFQQMSGINAVIFYATDIFKETGSDLDESLCTIIIGCVNFIATFLATTVIDRLGRKILLYVSSVTMTITLGLLGAYMYLKDGGYDVQNYTFVPLISLVLYIVGFSMGFGPIPWLMMGELLPSKIRGPAASLATSFNWTCTCMVTLSFKYLMDFLGSGVTFWMFTAICAVGFFFTLFCVPETKGKSLEDIEKKFQKTRRMSSIANLRPSPTNV